jgi:ATP-dependent DNA helicase RecG
LQTIATQEQTDPIDMLSRGLAKEENGQFQFDFVKQSLPLLTPEEIYALADQKLVQLLREDKRIERKPSGIQAKFLAEYFSMWANTPPDGGLIVVGIENDGGIINGCAGLHHNRLNDLESSGRQFCHDAKYISKRVPVKRDDGTGDFLVVFLVSYNSKKAVMTHSGEVYKRFGESKHRLRTDEVHELEIEKGQVDFELEPVDLRYPEHFDTKLIAEFVGSVTKSSGWGDHITWTRTARTECLLQHPPQHHASPCRIRPCLARKEGRAQPELPTEW